MAHAWESLILGGVDQPRILEITNNFCTNPYANTGTTGYVKGTNGTMTTESSSEAIGEYVIKLVFAGGGDAYIDWTHNFGSSITNKKFLGIVRIKSKFDCKIQLIGSSLISEYAITASDYVRTFSVIAEAIGQTGNNITLRIIGTADVNLTFDNIYLAQINNDITFPQPNESFMVFEKDVLGEQRMWNGKIQQFNFKYIPNFYCDWQVLGAGYEYQRQQISLNKILFCMPHKDVNWGFIGIFSEDFERKYSFDKFFGHNSSLAIKGIEYIYELPSIQPSSSGGGSIYIEDEDIIYES